MKEIVEQTKYQRHTNETKTLCKSKFRKLTYRSERRRHYHYYFLCCQS